MNGEAAFLVRYPRIVIDPHFGRIPRLGVIFDRDGVGVRVNGGLYEIEQLVYRLVTFDSNIKRDWNVAFTKAAPRTRLSRTVILTGAT